MTKGSKNESLKQQLIKGVSGSALIKVLNILLSLLVGVLLARVLGPEQYGIYAFVISIITILSIPTKAGLPTLAVKEIAQTHLERDWNRMRGLLSFSNSSVFAYSILIAFIAFLYIQLSGGLADLDRQSAFLWGLLLLPFIALEGVRTGALRGLRWVVVSQIPESVVKPLIMVGALASVMLFGEGLSAGKAVQLNITTAIVAFIVGSTLLYKALPEYVRAAKSTYFIGQWMRSLLPLSLFAGVQLLDAQVSMVILGLYGQNEDVALLKIAATGASLVVFSLTAVNMAIGPHVARLYASGEMAHLQRMLTVSVRGATFCAFVLVIIFTLFGGRILSIAFGEEYSAAAPLLIILSIAQLLNCSCGSVATLLQMTGNETSTIFGSVAGLVLNVLLGVLLIPTFGAVGAAIAFSVSIITWNLILAIMVKRKLGLVCWLS